MPPKAELARAGRRDLAKAVERWGGMEQLAALLHMEMPSAEQRRGSRRWRAHVARVAAQTGLGGTEVHPRTPGSRLQQKRTVVVAHICKCRGPGKRMRAAASSMRRNLATTCMPRIELNLCAEGNVLPAEHWLQGKSEGELALLHQSLRLQLMDILGVTSSGCECRPIQWLYPASTAPVELTASVRCLSRSSEKRSSCRLL